MTVAVLGAGGPTGLECVKRLASKGFAARAVVRDPSKYSGSFPEGTEVVAGDVTDPASLSQALQGANGVIFAASGKGYWSAEGVDHKGVENTIQAAPAGAHIVLVSSMLTHPSNRWSPIRILLNNIRYSLMDSKFKGEEALRKHPNYTIVRPGGLASGEGGRTEVLSALNATKEVGGGSISRADVAAVCVDALSNPAAKNVTVSIWTKKQPLPEGTSFEQVLQRLWQRGGGGAASS